ncbi:MAG: tetratricopeptide repeat protein [Pseudomonadota bacterium]
MTDLRTTIAVCLAFAHAAGMAPSAGAADVARSDPEIAACQRVEATGPAIDACSAIIDSPDWAGARAVWALNNRGLAHAARGNYLAALADYDAAIALDPDNAAAFSNRGNAHAALGDMLKALADHSRAIEIDPKYVSAWHNRGVDHEELGNPRAALADYRQALDLDPDHRGARLGLATANCRLGRAKTSSAARLDAINRGHIDPSAFQRVLQNAGHYRGPIDGKFGRGSRAALRAWTRAGCLPVR